MDAKTIYERTRLIESHIKARGFRGAATFRMNFVGSPIWFSVEAKENSLDDNRFASETSWQPKDFDDATLNKMFDEAERWVENLPSTLALTLNKLHKIIDSLPKEADDISGAVWDSVRKALLLEADKLSKNILPPERDPDVAGAFDPAKHLPLNDEDEIPF